MVGTSSSFDGNRGTDMCVNAIHLNRPDDPSAPGIALTEGKIVVGRASTCDIMLLDVSVSRCHAELATAGTKVMVRDLGSRNGTYVDEVRIQSRTVGPGQRIRFGGVAFIVTILGSQGYDARADLETESVSAPAGSVAVTNFSGLLLSAAERRVFDLLLEGLAEKQVAQRLNISRHTVHNHLREIYRTLDVHSRSELLARFVPRLNGETSLP